MNQTQPLNYFFRKFPVLRWITGFLFLAIIIAFSIILSFKTKPEPKISSLTPVTGSPGDLIVIKGENFGSSKDTNYVEFEGNNGRNRLTASSILSWKNEEIKLILPPNIQDGLVYVGNKDTKSNPKFFANAAFLPQENTENSISQIPQILSSSENSKTGIGKVLKLFGKNFGHTREKSKVYFSCERVNPDKNSKKDEKKQSLEISYIFADEDNSDYIYWSDSEIHVRIPDGASSGKIYVETLKGLSPSYNIKLNSKTGTKKFISPKTYVVKVEVDIVDSSTDKNSSIIIRCPRPVISVSQPEVNIIEFSPEPVIQNFQHTVIHQTSSERSAIQKKKFSQNFAVTTYETLTSVIEPQVENYTPDTINYLEYALEPDYITPCDDEKIISLAKKITGKEKNPYTKAKLIYNYMLNNFTLLSQTRSEKTSSLDILNTKTGDAYDFAVCFTSLLRASRIPALTDSGVLINPNLKSQNHWWTEFYIENVGWIPCDIAIAAGLYYQTWVKDINVKEFYFGNLDAQHITFSRGFNDIKAGFSNNKTVYRPKTFALQSIWEEASGEKIKYSSYWADPVIIGVY